MVRFHRFAPFVLIPALLLLSSCFAPQRAVLLEGIRKDPSAGAYIEDVPFYPQKDYMCGPAALASVTAYWATGKPDMEEIASGIYLEKLKGTLPMDMLLYARQKGFDAEFYASSMDDLREKLSAGYPLILFLNLGLKSYPVGHYVVAVGYSDAAEAVLVHSGTEKEMVMSYMQLEREWSLTGYSTLIVKPEAAR